MKKFLIIILFLLSTFITINAYEEGEDKKMYVAVYDRNLKHIANINNVKHSATKRLYDFDTSTFEGIASEDIKSGFIFSLCDDKGKQIYSGFMKNIKEQGYIKSFNGDDFRKICDTDVILDYATNFKVAPEYLGTLFDNVISGLKSTIYPSFNLLNIQFNIPEPSDNIFWIGNYDMQYLVVNAIKFLKTYLAIYGYNINTYFDVVNKKVVMDIVKNTDVVEIKLDDFIFDRTRTEVSTNKAIATIRYDNIERDSKVWIQTTKEYYDSLPPGDKSESILMFPEPVVDANDYIYGYGFKVRYQESGALEMVDYYYKVTVAATPRPEGLPVATYYLGNDNNIYQDNIPFDKVILPVKAKTFQNQFLDKAQADAISELVNSRYNENIMLSNKNSPIDLKKIKLGTMVKVYDAEGTMKILPLSEIDMNNDDYKVKLGLKKTLFTEVIKNG